MNAQQLIESLLTDDSEIKQKNTRIKTQQDGKIRTSAKTNYGNKIITITDPTQPSIASISAYGFIMTTQENVKKLNLYKDLESRAKAYQFTVDIEQNHQFQGNVAFDFEKKIAQYKYQKKLNREGLAIHLSGNTVQEEIPLIYELFKTINYETKNLR